MSQPATALATSSPAQEKEKEKARPNFYLWGAWRSKAVKEPFLTKKVSEPLKKVVVGETFIIVLSRKGNVWSWGEDKKDGCLGLGTGAPNKSKPEKIPGLENVMDIQMGQNHVVALTKDGQIYTWGNGARGKLGLGDGRTETQFSPKLVSGTSDTLNEQFKQIAVVKDSTFAVSQRGKVYAWGVNEDNILGLMDASRSEVHEPQVLTMLGDAQIHHIEIFEGRTIIAHVEGDDGENQLGAFAEDVTDNEVEIFKGIDEMRKTMEKTQEWWNHLLNIKHGQPYDTPHDMAARHALKAADTKTGGTLQDDLEVDIDKLKRAERHLDALVNAAKMELKRTQQIPGTRNVKFILCMFIDECRLRCEKVQMIISARQLMDAKRQTSEISARTVTDFGSDANEEIRKIIAVTKELQRMLDSVKKVFPVDVLTIQLKVTLMELLECKLLYNDRCVDLLKAAGDKLVDPMVPALRIIKDRWNSLKHFSLYSLYVECKDKQLDFGGNDDEHLAYLVNASNYQINQILEIDKDQIISHDTMVPALCYELLRENAELRKMANSYQLHVLMLYQHKNVSAPSVGMNQDYQESHASDDNED